MKHTYTRICGILFIIVFATLILDIFTSDNQVRTAGPVIELDNQQKLPIVINGDTTLVTLSRGDSVRILGFTRLTYHQDILVETSNGDRGELDASQLPIKQLVIEGEHQGDTVVGLVPKYLGLTVHEYLAKTSRGEEFELRGEDMVPVLDNWEDLNLDNNASTSVATRKGLEKTKGKSLEEIEKKYGMAYDILVNKDGSKKAGFRIYTYGSEGRPYKPSITFDRDGNAIEFEYKIVKDKANNGWILGFAPLAGLIIDMPLTRILTRSSSYSIPSDQGTGVPWYLYVGLVFVLVFGIAWYCLTPSLLVLFIGWMIAYPPVFRLFSNKTLKAIITAVSVVGFYYWAIALMAWGMHWLLVIPLLPVSYYCTRWATEYLNLYVPHQRCPRCKSIHTIAFDHDEVTDTKFMKGSDIKRDKLLDRRHSEYQTWTEVTTTSRNRSTGATSSSTHRENVQDHTMRHDTYQYIDYEVTYFVTFYLNHFICNKCQYHETNTSTTQEEVDRRIIGSHTDTESYEI